MGMDVYGANGGYFRANIWQWRAILYAMELAGYEVPPGWGNNSGAGLSSKPECIALAKQLYSFLKRWDDQVLTMETDAVRIDAQGCIVEPGTPNTYSPYRVHREHIEEFIEFLKDCGGSFEIH